MKPRFLPQQLRQTKPSEYALRFVFGGVVALVASAVAHAWGPRVGGLFLAFPALLPAGLLLVKRHDGRGAAVDDARGAVLGSLALIGFGIVIWGTADRLLPWLSLTLALTAWVAVSVGAWWCLFAWRSSRHERCTALFRGKLDESER